MSINSKTQELKARMQSLLQGGGEKAVEKQKATGKLTARERILELLDEGTFHEYDLFIQHSGKDFNMDKKILPGDGVEKSILLNYQRQCLKSVRIVLW
jgi:acetyl-CoA carboxylase carboxyltransferase component